MLPLKLREIAAQLVRHVAKILALGVLQKELALALAAVSPLSGAGQRADTTPVPAALSDFFKPGVVLQDRNGDGAIDIITTTDRGTFIFWGKPGGRSKTRSGSK